MCFYPVMMIVIMCMVSTAGRAIAELEKQKGPMIGYHAYMLSGVLFVSSRVENPPSKKPKMIAYVPLSHRHLALNNNRHQTYSHPQLTSPAYYHPHWALSLPTSYHSNHTSPPECSEISSPPPS